MVIRAPKLDYQWDAISIGPNVDSGQCLRIRATREDLDLVAGWLLGSLGFAFPDQEMQRDTDKPLTNLNQALMNAARYIGIQMLGDAEDCMPYPILRVNPDNECQTQQSLDGGTTWTVVFDTSVCQPEMPTIPPMIIFRQTTSNPELLQQSLDNGVTWTVAYDYSRISSASLVENNILYNQIQNTLNTYNQAWDESSHDVNVFAPDMVFDGGDTEDDQQRDKAICYAIGVWYDITRQVAVDYAATKNDLLATHGGLVVGAAVSGVGTPLAGAVAGAVVTVLVKGVSLLGARSQDDAYTAARDDIICCMYTNLAGGTLTQGRFQGAVDGCGFEGGSNTEAIRGLIETLVQDTSNYLAFLKVASAGFDYAEFAQLPDCPCAPPPDCTEVSMDVAVSPYATGFYSGVTVHAGDVIEITASGSWTGDDTYDADGFGAFGPQPQYLAPAIKIYAAIAKVEGDSEWTYIGYGATFSASRDGRVMLNVNGYPSQGVYNAYSGSLDWEICVSDPSITLTATGYLGQVFGTFPDEAITGAAFDAASTPGPVTGNDEIIAIMFSAPCKVHINSMADWAFCPIGPYAALYGYCPATLDPANLSNWIFTREASGETSIPIPWDVEARGIWLESLCGATFTANLTLTLL